MHWYGMLEMGQVWLQNIRSQMWKSLLRLLRVRTSKDQPEIVQQGANSGGQVQNFKGGTLLSSSETTDILERVCSRCNQTVVDYIIYNIVTPLRQELAFNALIAEGLSSDQADEFIARIEDLHNSDQQKVDYIKQILRYSDEEMVDLANIILRVFK
jgi:hypothetical protein